MMTTFEKMPPAVDLEHGKSHMEVPLQLEVGASSEQAIDDAAYLLNETIKRVKKEGQDYYDTVDAMHGAGAATAGVVGLSAATFGAGLNLLSHDIARDASMVASVSSLATGVATLAAGGVF